MDPKEVRKKTDELASRILEVQGQLHGRPYGVRKIQKDLETDIQKAQTIIQELADHLGELDSRLKSRLLELKRMDEFEKEMVAKRFERSRRQK